MGKRIISGNAYIEYLMLVLLIAFGLMWFYDGGNFQGTRDQVNTSFNSMIDEITTP
jgi:hypothetical protein